MLQVGALVSSRIGLDTGSDDDGFNSRPIIETMDFVGGGIWAGALYISAGSLGLKASIQRTKRL